METDALVIPSDLRRFSASERAVRRALLIPHDVDRASAGDIHGAFSRSVVVSAIRCLLTYIVLPFIAPLVGWIQGVGPAVGLLVGTVAIGFNLASMRRFFVAEHRWRWGYFTIGASVIALLLVLMAHDLSRLFS